MTRKIVPVAVGQVRIDPIARCPVEVLAVGVAMVIGDRPEHVRICRRSGRTSLVKEKTVERWEVVE